MMKAVQGQRFASHVVQEHAAQRESITRREMMKNLGKGAMVIAVMGLPKVTTAAAEELKLKKRVAVVPFDWSGHDTIADWTIPVGFRNAIYEKLVKKLLDTGKFVVLERGALQDLDIEKSLKEENTGKSQRGKIVPAQALVKGKVVDFELANKGGGSGISIGGIGVGMRRVSAKVRLNVRIFDVDTSELLGSEDGEGEAKSQSFDISGGIGGMFASYEKFEKTPLGEATTKAIDKAVEIIVRRLEGQPWMARVADWDEAAKEVTINAGSDLGVSTGLTFDVHRVTKVIIDPETGAVLGQRTGKAGVIRIKAVEQKLAFAEVIEGNEFKAGDVVRTRS